MIRILNHADGVSGHYCIARRCLYGVGWEYYDGGSWCAFDAGELFTSMESAEAMWQELQSKDLPVINIERMTVEECEQADREISGCGDK